jgi:hypothetical protein
MKTLRRNDITFENPPEGTYTAIITTVADLGLQSSKFDPSGKQQIGIEYELTDEVGSDSRKLTVVDTYTATIHEKAKLSPVIMSAFGKVPDEFDPRDLLGQIVSVTVIHREDSQGRTWANVESVGGLPDKAKKGVTTDTPLVVFDLDKPDAAVYQQLPRLFRSKIENRIRPKEGDDRPKPEPVNLPW